MRLIAWILLFAAVFPAVAGEVVIPISGPRIEAHELAAALPGWRPANPNADLAPSPLPGSPRRISRALLESWTLSAGADASALPDLALVERTLNQLTSESAAAVVRQAVAAETGLDHIEVEITPGQELPAPPAEKLEWSLIGRAPDSAGEATLRLRWQDASGRTGVELIRARVQATGEWLEAVRDLPSRQRISAADFRLIRGPLPSLNERFLVSLQDVGPAELKRFLRAGEPLAADLLRTTTDVSRGDLIDLKVRAGAVVLRVPAQAEADAQIGETVPLKNLETGRRIVGRITSHKTAEAELR